MVTTYLTDIVREFKQAVAEKYILSNICLFGSNARGEATEDSDIDIFLQIVDLTMDIEQDVYNMAYELELKYDWYPLQNPGWQKYFQAGSEAVC